VISGTHLSLSDRNCPFDSIELSEHPALKLGTRTEAHGDHRQ